MVVDPRERSRQKGLGKNYSGSATPASETAAKDSDTSEKSGQSGKSGPKILRYPFTKLDKSDDYLKIEIYDFIAPGIDFAKSGNNQLLRLRTSDEVYEGGKQKVLATIILPIPEGITDSNAASWEAGGLNPVASGIAAVTNTFLAGAETADIGKSLQDSGKLIKDLVSQITKTGGESAQRILSGYTAGLVANSIAGSSVGAVVGRSNGIALNPNQQLLFNSTVGRSFNFGWDIIPRSKDEAEMVKKIIRELKTSMSPTRDSTETVSGIFLKSPRVFRLQYMSGASKHPFLNSFKTMALTQMSVNYTGSGTYATYDDATPVHMQLSVGFSELTAIYSGDYDNVGGVGY